MKIANAKGLVAKGMMLALAAGALTIAVPAKAEAQRFAVGVRVGGPYYAPAYDRPAWDRHEAFVRQEEWIRFHRFHRDYRHY
jgi:hypothetical protein